MAKIICVFDEATLIGKRVADSRGISSGEITREIDITLCGNFINQPGRYLLAGAVVAERAEWAAEEAAQEAAQDAAIAALEARIVEIETARAAEGLQDYTVQQGTDWITTKLTNAPNSYVGIKQAVGEILIKMLPYILPKN